MRIKMLLASLIVGLSGISQAELHDRGGGMIYDDVLDITWLSDASFGAGSPYDDGVNTTNGQMSWANAIAWADDLVFGGLDDWRLPSMDVNKDQSDTIHGQGIVDCSSATELACRDNELGYMFYHNLTGDFGGPDYPDQGLFTNITGIYWSSTEYALVLDATWSFFFYNGAQYASTNQSANGAWAVRSGDVAVVPLPAGIWLLGTGLVGLMVVRRRL